MTFAEYLLEQGVLAPEELVEALIAQTRAMPTVFETVHRLGLMPAADLIRVVATQSSERVDFITASKALGKWTPAIDEAVMSELGKARVPLLQLVGERKSVDPSRLTKVFDTFLSERKRKPAGPSPAVKEFCDLFNENIRGELAFLLAGPATGETTEVAAAICHRMAGAALFAGLAELKAGFETLEAGIKASSAKPEALDALWAQRVSLSNA